MRLTIIRKLFRRIKIFDSSKRFVHLSISMNSRSTDVNKYIKMLGNKYNTQEIERLLTQREEYVNIAKVDSTCPVKEVFINELGANSKIEDRWCIGVNQLEGKISSLLAGVVDGHSGRDCAQIVNKAAVEYLAASLLNRDKLEICYKDMKENPHYTIVRNFHYGHWETLNDSVKSHFKKCLYNYIEEILENETRKLVPEIVMKEALVRLDRDMCIPTNENDLETWFKSRPMIRASVSGAVGIFSRIYWLGEEKSSNDNPHNYPTLHVANVGDPGGLIARYDNDKQEIIATALSNPHNCQNFRELERIQSQHPNDSPEQLFRDNRLLGELACTRAFGDARYKWPEKWLNKLYQSFNLGETISYVPSPYTNPPYLTAEPEILKFILDPSVKFVVLASDGLWDTMSPDEAARIVSTCPIEVSPATTLLKAALTHSSASQTGGLLGSAGGNHNKLLSMHLALPLGTARYFRDDITVMVMKF